MIITTKRLRYESWRKNHHLFTVVILLRLVTGMHLVDSGLRKMIGERHLVGADTNLLFFLDGFFQLGFYWSWIGLVELLTAFLLMGQRLSALGALVCLFIASSVGMLGISIGWGRITPQVLVFFSSLLLLVWDFYKLRPLFVWQPQTTEAPAVYPEAPVTWHRAGIWLFIVSIAGFVLREIFPGTGLLVHQFVTFLFFVTVSYSYFSLEKAKKKNPVRIT